MAKVDLKWPCKRNKELSEQHLIYLYFIFFDEPHCCMVVLCGQTIPEVFAIRSRC